MQGHLTKAEKARTRAQLEAALGKPDKFEKLNSSASTRNRGLTKASDGES